MAKSIAARILTKRTAIPPSPPPPTLESADATEVPPPFGITWRGQRPGAYLELEDKSRIWADSEIAVLPEFLLPKIRLSDLRKAGGRILRYWADVPVTAKLPEGHEGFQIAVAATHPDVFWPLASHCEVDDFGRYTCDLIITDAHVFAETYVETSCELSEEVAARIAAHAASRSGAELTELDLVGGDADGQAFRLRLAIPERGRFASQLVATLVEVAAVLDATASGAFTAATASTLIQAGHVSWLVGQEESNWLDAKSAPWDLSGDAGKVSLAEDVARFANAQGGILVVGAKTKLVNDGEVISSVRGIARGLLKIKQLEDSLDAHLYPPVEGLAIFKVPMPKDREVVALVVEPQLERAKPFLVHGVVASGRVEGAFFSIVRRRGQRSIPVTAREVHAWLAAGRSLLDRSQESPPSNEAKDPKGF